MDYRLTKGFCAKCYASWREKQPNPTDEDVAAFWLMLHMNMALITSQRLDAVELDARILQLAGQGIPRATIALRVGLPHRQRVFEALRRHQEARRAALKAAG